MVLLLFKKIIDEGDGVGRFGGEIYYFPAVARLGFERRRVFFRRGGWRGHLAVMVVDTFLTLTLSPPSLYPI